MLTPWPLVPLSEVLTRSQESVQLAPQETYRQVTVRMWGKGAGLRNEVKGATIAGERRLLVRAGQLVLSRIDARHGALAIVPPSLDGAIVSNDFPAFAVDSQRLDHRFLGWMCRAPWLWELCRSASEGTTNRVRLVEDRFLSTSVPLPPLDEQRRIVARIEQLAAMIEEARTLRTQVCSGLNALTSTVRTQVFIDVSARETVRLDTLATLERGRFSHRPRNDPRFFGGDHPWIQIAEIESAEKYIRAWSQTLNDAGLAISRKFPRGTVLVSIAATIGAVGILDFDCCIPDSIVAVTPGPRLDAEFVYQYLLYLRGDLERIAPQSAQKNINLSILAPLPVPRLPLHEQRQIVAYLDNFQSRINVLRHRQVEANAELDALLPSILDRAFKGEL